MEILVIKEKIISQECVNIVEVYKRYENDKYVLLNNVWVEELIPLLKEDAVLWWVNTADKTKYFYDTRWYERMGCAGDITGTENLEKWEEIVNVYDKKDKLYLVIKERFI